MSVRTGLQSHASCLRYSAATAAGRAPASCERSVARDARGAGSRAGGQRASCAWEALPTSACVLACSVQMTGRPMMSAPRICMCDGGRTTSTQGEHQVVARRRRLHMNSLGIPKLNWSVQLE